MKKTSTKTELDEVVNLNALTLEVWSTISEKGNESAGHKVQSTGKTLPPIGTEGAEALEERGQLEFNGRVATFEMVPMKVRVARGEPMVLHPLGLQKVRAKVTAPAESIGGTNLTITVEWYEEEKEGKRTGRWLPFLTASRQTEGGGGRGRAAREVAGVDDLGF